MGNYWSERFVDEEQRMYKLITKEVEREFLEYDKAIVKINKDIEIWYNRIAKNNEISLADAKQLLNKNELKEFKWTLEEYSKYAKENVLSKKWSKELENASAKVHIQRLEALKIQTKGHIEKLYNDCGKSFNKHIKEIYNDKYNHIAYELAKGTGVGKEFTKLNDNLINEVIKKPWTLDGIHFSDRIWKDKEKLVNTIHTELTQGFIRGDSLDTMTKRITKKMNVSKFNARRLVYTESAAYTSKATLESYKDMGVEKYEILAAMDSRTSDICRNLDGKIFDIKDYEVGVTAPPFHVMCRTTTVPYFEDFDEDEEYDYDLEELEKESKKNDEKELKKDEDEGIIKEKEYKLLNDFDIEIYQEQSNKVFSKLDDLEKEALAEYTTGGYVDINYDLANNIKNPYENDLNNALKYYELKEDIIVFRGTKFDYYKDLNIGDVFNGKVFYSTSLELDQARAFANDFENGVILKIKVPKRSKGLYIGSNTSYGVNEKEFLLSNNTKYRVIEISRKEITLEVLDDKGIDKKIFE